MSKRPILKELIKEESPIDAQLIKEEAGITDAPATAPEADAVAAAPEAALADASGKKMRECTSYLDGRATCPYIEYP